jgi:hypothetical protein
MSILQGPPNCSDEVFFGRKIAMNERLRDVDAISEILERKSWTLGGKKLNRRFEQLLGALRRWEMMFLFRTGSRANRFFLGGFPRATILLIGHRRHLTRFCLAGTATTIKDSN